MNYSKLLKYIILFFLSNLTFGEGRLISEVFDGKEITSYFNSDLASKLSCRISEDIRKNYPDTSYKSHIKSINRILDNEIEQIAQGNAMREDSVLNIFLNISQSDYYLQNGVILYGNDDLESENSEDWLSAYLYLARKTEIAYLSGDCQKKYLSTTPVENLKDLISPFVDIVSSGEWIYRDDEGEVIGVYDVINKNDGSVTYRSKLTMSIGDHWKPEYKKYEEHFLKINKLSTPLFLWAIEQDHSSISHVDLYEKAYEIYDDPFVALGVITWISIVDSHISNRDRTAVVANRMKPIVNGQDNAGYQYHFWGYALNALVGKGSKYNLLSFAYENWYQEDYEDRFADKLGLSLGKKVKELLENDNKEFQNQCR